MKRPRTIGIGIVILIVLGLFRHFGESFNEIEYRGQLFKLTRTYSDYEDYKDDADKLAPGQEAQVEQAVLGAKLEPSYAGREDLIHAASGVRFPGFGMTSYGERTQPDGTILSATSVEIPMSTKERVFVYLKGSGPYMLAEDFVLDIDHDFRDIALKDGKIEYTDSQGTVVASHAIRGGKDLP